MEVDEVVNEESLARYLNGLPEGERGRVALRVAFGAAARVLPFDAAFVASDKESIDAGVSCEPIFGAVSICEIAVNTIDMKALGYVDYRAANAIAVSCHYASKNPTLEKLPTSAAAAWAANAVELFLSGPHNDLVFNAVEAVRSASTHAPSDVWGGVLRDLEAKTAGPLWHDSTMPKAVLSKWIKTRAILQNKHNSDWSFWIAWYERVLAGRDTLPAEMAPILNAIGEADWKKGPAHINPMFDGVLGLYRAEEFQSSHSYGFRSKLDRELDRLDLEAVEPIDLGEIVKKMRSALADYKRRSEREKTGNQLHGLCYDALKPEIADFRRVLSKYKNDPQALHDQTLRYEKHFIRVLQDRDLPQAAEVASLIDDMRNMQSEICLASDVVREKEALRTAIAIEKATEAQKLQAIRNCLGMMSDGTGEMELFAGIAVKALVNPEASAAEKQMAWQFAFRLGANAATTIKSYEDEIGAEKTDLGKRVKDISDMAVAGDKFIDVIQEAVAEGHPWVDAFLKHIGQDGFPGIMT